MFDEDFECNRSGVYRVIMKHMPFYGMSTEEKERLADTFQKALYFEGEYIFCQETWPIQFGIIGSGTAEIIFDTKNNKKLIIQTIGPNEFFGLFAISPAKKALYNIRCSGPVVCYVQKPADFESMIEKYPQVKEYIYDILLNRIWKIYDSVNKNPDKDKNSIPSGSSPPRHFEKAMEYIAEHYMDSLTLTNVANVAGISKYHFSRLFKSKTGCTFKEYLNHKRIEAAKNAIRTEGMNVSQACFAVGFNDLSYFSRVFRKIEGISPSYYQKNFG